MVKLSALIIILFILKNLGVNKEKQKLLGDVSKNNQFWPKSRTHFTD
jgi:hypothetical protein